ncbi:MAG TPA: type II toxin-antitoxin system VapC family toxin [Casimicrobiaceae bacterium]|nr:type II toxin-antitoxin system VapC family toxin [Casimicrobiaceae bacterium]
MKIVDLNMLLYAVNSDAKQHQRARAWWEAAVVDEERVGLPWVVLLGFLRLATNARVFPKPLSPDSAISKVEAWLGQENIQVVRERDDHWECLRELLRETGVAGNLTSDAHLAALALCHDAVLVSSDRDFARFKGLRVENPIA